ncbi:potassium transporter TrkA [Vineibacter terrae]|uniref:Potassium transporter TrkA n=1 Tax=Vineibacter terrae TaxID=2586908 RepID=A0A5C8PV80_9HYPH|nr:cation:proton antiporter [Vineibacter terrae]TXL82218.1 potassium transporter TrkA [Vineibacter terrae]
MALDLEPYKDTLLFLGTAGLVVPLFHRLRISPVLGFLAAGIALGPSGLGRLAADIPWLAYVTIDDIDRIAHLAEFGVVFLLFMIGLELSWERLTTLRRLVFGLGSLQVAASATVIGAAAYVLGQTPAASAVLGTALALSSTAIVLPVLADRKRLNSPAGRASFAVLLLQDLAVAPMLFMVAMLGAHEGSGIGTGLLLAFVPAAVGLLVLVVLGRLVLRPLFHSVAATRSTELFMATCLLVVIGTGLVTAATGLTMALGAFIAGMLLAETEFRREIEVTIEPFKGLLLGLFFVSIGAGLDVPLLVDAAPVVLGLALALIVGKALIVMGLAHVVGLAPSVGREVAVLLGPCGEFAFVLLTTAMALRVVPANTGGLVMVAVSLTMVMIPVVAIVGERAARRAVKAELPAFEPVPVDDQERVLIVGYGRVGKLVGEMLSRHDVPYLAVDGDPRVVASERAAGRKIYFGDASRPEFLRRSGIDKARALVATMDDPAAVERVVAAAHAERAGLTIVARARDADHATRLYALGATDAVPETIEASLQLSEALLVEIGLPMGLVIASIHEKRDEIRKVLDVPGAPATARRIARRTFRRRARGEG